MLLGLVGALETVEIGGHLNGGVAVQWRTGRNTIVDLDRKFRFLERLIQIGKREQRQRVAGAQEKRQLQVDQAKIFSAAPAERGAKAIERFSGAELCVGNERRQFLSRLELVHRLNH